MPETPGRFLRGLGPRLQMKLMVIPVGRSLVFSGSQAKNISYSTDHRQKIFRTLPQAAWFFRITGKKYFVPYRSQAKNISYSTSDGLGRRFFSSDIMWWLGDWTRLILHQLPLPRKSLKRGKDILVSTSWWEVARILGFAD